MLLYDESISVHHYFRFLVTSLLLLLPIPTNAHSKPMKKNSKKRLKPWLWWIRQILSSATRFDRKKSPLTQNYSPNLLFEESYDIDAQKLDFEKYICIVALSSYEMRFLFFYSSIMALFALGTSPDNNHEWITPNITPEWVARKLFFALSEKLWDEKAAQVLLNLGNIGNNGDNIEKTRKIWEIQIHEAVELLWIRSNCYKTTV